MATDQKTAKIKKGSINHTNIDIQAMLAWLFIPFMIFLQFLIRRRSQCAYIFYIYSFKAGE